MKTERRQVKQAVLDALEAWGIRLSPARATARQLTLLLPAAQHTDDMVRVGYLSVEGGELVFKYSNTFQERGLPPIPEFPNTGCTYRSKTLWPFFEERIPPTERLDIQTLIRERKLDLADRFGLLETLGRKTIASPYVLEPTPSTT